MACIFFPVDQIPDAVLNVAQVFPVYHLAQGLLEGFDPNGAAGGIDPTALAVLLAWGAAGAVVALRTFRWEPQAREALFSFSSARLAVVLTERCDTHQPIFSASSTMIPAGPRT